ncbi:DNA polymerase III subunit delta [Granulicella sp. 5B5]|uniref:DNA polymerase III subunit delta n=1 Tax=Granulicella sp. 5B5 TaxID=1617967 RepID=UPI0015F42E36|nr:DNA polymerase III subunit delta [Granulicella sp. 5B5]QMV17815.1 DNA polymerase III subunit delta [Granulicella sp. 5B5]
MSTAQTSGLKSFAAAERFLAEVSGDARRPGYVLLGDEAFLYEICRKGVLAALVPDDMRDFCLHDLDLASTSIFDALDLAQTPSLMAPFQVLFIRNLKLLYGRGQKKDEFAVLDAYFRSPNPQALLIFVADHIALPQDLRRMDMTDKERVEKIRETLGDSCGIVELQRVSEDDAIKWVLRESKAKGVVFTDDAARELVDALSADMLTIASEMEKLLLYAGAMQRNTVELADVETMVSAAKQRSLYELTDAISQKDAPRALALLHGLLNASDGGEDAAIGHVFMLAKTYRQMLILNEKQVKDSRAIWQVLWPGFRVAPFAADALIAQARRYRDRSDLTRGLRAIAKADLELRSSPPDKRLVLERLVMRLAGKATESELEAVS